MSNPDEVLGGAAPTIEKLACRRIPKHHLTLFGGRSRNPADSRGDVGAPSFPVPELVPVLMTL